MNRLFVALLCAISCAHINAQLVLKTNTIIDQEEKRHEVILDQDNKGALDFGTFKLGFDVKKQEQATTEQTEQETQQETYQVTITVVDGEQEVAHPTVTTTLGETKTIKCSACPCTRNDVDYALELTLIEQNQ